jgi:hypothetical protein
VGRALAHGQGLVHADGAVVLVARAEERGQREVRLAVLDVLLDDPAQLGDHVVVIARDVMDERAHVRAAVARRALEHAVVGDVVAADEHAGGERAQPDQEHDQRGAH